MCQLQYIVLRSIVRAIFDFAQALNILYNYDSFLVTCNVNPCGLLIVTCNRAGLPREITEEDTRDKYATLKSEYLSTNELKGNRLYKKAILFLFPILQVSTMYRQTWNSC
jgi:hypothetical protein